MWFSNDIYVDTSYYRRFIANSSKVAKPLAPLTQKIQKYEWVKEQKEAFQTLKDNLYDTPILSLPDGSKEFVVYCDASNQGLGCVLMQRGKVENATAEMLRGLDQLMERKEGGGMYLLWVPLIGDVRTLMMDEAHASRYLVHSGADKTYYDLRDMYGGHVWRRILLPMSHVLWAEIGEIRSIESELIQEATNKVVLIKEKLKAARDCQKSYVGNMRKHLELKLEYWMDANMHVPLERIKVDNLRFLTSRIPIVKSIGTVEIIDHFAEEPVEIIDRKVKSLKRSRILIVKSIGTRSE
ncbi:putative reverse transcriptase domain-containing protein, partial [Tanacetum coccineum]